MYASNNLINESRRRLQHGTKHYIFHAIKYWGGWTWTGDRRRTGRTDDLRPWSLFCLFWSDFYLFWSVFICFCLFFYLCWSLFISFGLFLSVHLDELTWPLRAACIYTRCHGLVIKLYVVHLYHLSVNSNVYCKWITIAMNNYSLRAQCSGEAYFIGLTTALCT